MERRVEIPVGDRIMKIETGRLAKQANGSVLIQYGDTIVLVTACFDDNPREGGDFFPLTVDYREYTYAAGKIPGGFFKREGKPTEKEVLTSRLIDRSIRPLFPEGYYNETQVIASVLSADQENDPDVLGLVGASAALYLSKSPFNSPIAGVRVGLIDNQLVLNPTNQQQTQSSLEIVVAGTETAIVMVEALAREMPEEKMIEAIMFGHEAIKKIISAIKQLFNSQPYTKNAVPPVEYPTDIVDDIRFRHGAAILSALNVSGKLASRQALKELEESILSEIPEEEEEKREWTEKAFHKVKEELVRNQILQGQRSDGRAANEVRPIDIQVGLLPRTHGSALFTRGETQALATVTLGTSEDAQIIDELEGESKRRFMLHYNFPPFSVAEVGFLRAPSRREIGHGALADKAIRTLLPDETTFPYTIRLVSDILESNGSSSMATVCGGVLALMDAGVPLKSPAAGVAMGLIMEGERYSILTDIAGEEDHTGDMDFKVAGTREGITALQMDVKLEGLSANIMHQALNQAKEARLFILDKMLQVLPEHRSEISSFAPRLITMKIPTDKIREVIGPGGKVIRGIIEQTGVKIDVQDDGTVTIASADESAAKKAQQIIEGITATAEKGRTYLGKVQRIAEYGAFVEIIPGTVGLLHVSEMAPYRVHEVRDLVTEGQELMVRVIEIGDDGKIRLSHKEFAQATPPPGYNEGRREREPERPRREGEYRPRSQDRDREYRGRRSDSNRRGPRSNY
ncbi:polyribonucleotide nucleotidyltransferase [bacterium]|nr:polyribonucleotide nucleotidyltransferase [bacterium]